MADEWTSEIDASFARAICDRLDAIAALGAERHAPEAAWTAAAAAEQRLTEAVERLLKLEGSAARIADEARRVASGGGDAKRAWSVALLLGSAPTFDAVDAAVSTLRCPTAASRAAAAEALSLARNAAVGPALARLMEDAGPAACASALEVLRFRRQAPYASCVVLLGHPEARVAAAAARGLATVAVTPSPAHPDPPYPPAQPVRKAAAAVLRRVLGDDPDEALALAAAESLLALGDPAGLAYVRGELEAESASPSLSDDVRVAFVRLLALAGDASDLELFFRSVEPSPRDAAAVGWFGHPDLVDWLIGSLETANEARRAGARGRGAAPGQATPFEVAAAQALARIAGTPEGVSGTDGGAWRSWWVRARARIAPGLKHRFGRPYTPEATLDELAGDGNAAARANAALELAIVTGGSASVETGDWVTRQQAAIAAARERIAGMGAWTAGAFPGRRLGR